MGGNASLLYTAVSVDFLLLLKVRADSDLHSGVRLEAIGEMRSGDRHSQYDGERGLSCERGLCCERDVTVSDTRYVKWYAGGSQNKRVSRFSTSQGSRGNGAG